MIEAIDSHTEGEPTRILTGFSDVAGDTMAERRATLLAEHDDVRRALVREPRGTEAIVLAYLTRPEHAQADAGVVFANDAGYLGMCGHGAIGVATVLVRTGRVPAREPCTDVVLDTPVGQVRARVAVRDARPRSVAIANVPSFVHELGVRVQPRGLPAVDVDIAWGGNWFGFVRGRDLGLTPCMAELEALMAAAIEIRAELERRGVRGVQPTDGEDGRVDHIKIYADETDGDGPATRALTLCPGRAYDRSPCGTGTSAKLAVLHARGEIAVGQRLRSRSVLGTEFGAVITGVTTVEGRAAVLPEIEGTAFITGVQRFVLDPDDPLRAGIEPPPASS